MYLAYFNRRGHFVPASSARVDLNCVLCPPNRRPRAKRVIWATHSGGKVVVHVRRD